MVPVSQVGMLLNKIHSGGSHRRDNYTTIASQYSNVPRKAVRLFASKCHGCQRMETKPRNKKQPQAIVVAEVRQRYTLDLIDMDEWRKESDGDGNGLRYVAQMIDHTSKLTWTEAIKDKSAPHVRRFVRRVFAEYGYPVVLHTDNGMEFANAELERECRNWGSYMVHGRPYHPQSQGVVERPNGVLQSNMKAYQMNHPQVTNWVDMLLEVTRIHNNQVHQTTRQKPAQYFMRHNLSSMEKKPIPAGQRVVLTVSEVEAMEKLRWGVPCDVTCAATASTGSATTPTQQQSPVTGVQADSGVHQLLARANSSDSEDAFRQLDILQPAGAVGRFHDPGWARSLGEIVAEQLRPVATLAQGDCGPAAAWTSLNGKVATVDDAVVLRKALLEWTSTKAGERYYNACAVDEKVQLPGSLKNVQEECQGPREWVSHDWFTCFGGMMGLNVFVLSKIIWPTSLGYGIRLVTNGGALIEADYANTIAVYFQAVMPTAAERTQRGHWESVQDINGGHLWHHSDSVVQHCLLVAAQRMRLDIIRKQMTDKHLKAAQNRVNRHNEKIDVGDCVWLTMPQQVINEAKTMLRKRKEKRHTESKMLVKVVRIVRLASAHGKGVAERFVLLSQDGILAGTYPINELRLCKPPPQQYPVTRLPIPADINSDRPVKHKRIKLVTAYKKYIRWLCTTQAITAKENTDSEMKARRAAAADKPPAMQSGARTPAALLAATDAATAATDAAVTAAAAALLHSVAFSQMTSATAATGSTAAGLGAADIMDMTTDDAAPDLPCTLCKQPVSSANLVSCFNDNCRAPLHMPGTGCTSQPWVIDKLLIYCSRTCASADRRPGAAHTSKRTIVTLAHSQPIAGTSGSATIRPGPANAAAVKTIRTTVCKTCQQEITQEDKAVCDQCFGYIHKLNRDGTGCTRAGWSRSGSCRVDGLISCAECRFANDPDWVKLSKTTAQATTSSALPPAAAPDLPL